VRLQFTIQFLKQIKKQIRNMLNCHEQPRLAVQSTKNENRASFADDCDTHAVLLLSPTHSPDDTHDAAFPDAPWHASRSSYDGVAW
jgi:hypothetical protein